MVTDVCRKLEKLMLSTASGILGNSKDLHPYKSHCHYVFNIITLNCGITSGGNAYQWLLVTWNTSSLKTCNKIMVLSLQYRKRIHIHKSTKPEGLKIDD